MSVKEALKTIAPYAIGAVAGAGIALGVGALVSINALIIGTVAVGLSLAGVSSYQFKKDEAQGKAPLKPGVSPVEDLKRPRIHKLTIARVFSGAALGLGAGVVASILITQKNMTPEQKRKEEIGNIEAFCQPPRTSCTKNADGSYTIRP